MEKVFIERGVSGSKPLAERPQGSNLIAVLDRGDVLISSKLDRVFRSALDALKTCQTFKDRGLSLHLLDLGGDVTGDGLAKAFMTCAAAFSELDSARIRERIQDVKADQRARGRYLGGAVPFGYKAVGKSGNLAKDPEQQKAITAMRRMRRAGKSYRVIAEAMKAKGFAVSYQTVRRLVAAD